MTSYESPTRPRPLVGRVGSGDGGTVEGEGINAELLTVEEAAAVLAVPTSWLKPGE